jgi:hypothetical protein
MTDDQKGNKRRARRVIEIALIIVRLLAAALGAATLLGGGRTRVHKVAAAHPVHRHAGTGVRRLGLRGELPCAGRWDSRVVSGTSTSTTVPVPAATLDRVTITPVSTSSGTGDSKSGAGTVVTAAPAAATSGSAPSISYTCGPTVIVSWSPPATTGSAKRSFYTVHASTGGPSVEAAPTATTVIVNGLIVGNTYTFAVSATNAVGTSATSAPSDALTIVGCSTTGPAVVIGSNVGRFIVLSTTTPTLQLTIGGTVWTLVLSPGTWLITQEAQTITTSAAQAHAPLKATVVTSPTTGYALELEATGASATQSITVDSGPLAVLGFTSGQTSGS